MARESPRLHVLHSKGFSDQPMLPLGHFPNCVGTQSLVEASEPCLHWADRQYMALCALPLLRRIRTSISWKTSVQKVWSTSDDVNHGESRLKNNFKWNVWGERKEKKSCCFFVLFFSLKVPLRVRHKWMWAQNELITASPSPRVLGRHKVEGEGSRWAESLVSFSTPCNSRTAEPAAAVDLRWPK